MRFSTLGYSIKQGVKNIWRNKMFSLASIATMGACIFLFGIFFAVVINFNYIVKNAETDVSMTVFFNEDVDQATIDEIGTEIKAKTDVVKECKYVSADETWENFAKQYFEGKEEYKDGFKPNDNPLATSAHYEVYVYQVETQDALAEYIRSLDSPTSYTFTIFGWDSPAAACASVRNLRIKVLSSRNSGFKTLTATMRFSLWSFAL